MRKEDLFEILGDIPVEYIETAHRKKNKVQSALLLKWGIIAACFTMLLISIPVMNGLRREEKNDILKDNRPNQIVDLQADKYHYSVTEQTDDKDTEKEPMQDTQVDDLPADDIGEYAEIIEVGGMPKEVSEFYGGCYIDDNGKFMVVLTNDTPENRAVICKELGRKESNTGFVEGKYTLEYLTNLQKKISNAMANKEIPFVVSSGVYENLNCIIITVTTDDEAELEKVYALDTIGGAIKVEQGSQNEIEVLIAPKSE